MNPVNTDMRMLNVIRKRVKSSEDAAVEASQAGRNDLVLIEESQRSILNAYLEEANPMTKEEIGATVRAEVEKFKSRGVTFKSKGMMMGMIIKESGAFQERFVDKDEIAQAVSAAFDSST